MSIKTLILGVAAVASVALPGVASAQSYYGYGNGGYGNGYYDRGYGDRDGYRDYRDDRHAEHRYEQRRRWEERQRRNYWKHLHHDRERYDRDGYGY